MSDVLLLRESVRYGYDLLTLDALADACEESDTQQEEASYYRSLKTLVGVEAILDTNQADLFARGATVTAERYFDRRTGC